MNLFPESASTFSGDIDWLGTLISIIVFSWFFVSFGAMLWFLFRFRESKSPKASYITGEDWKESRWVEIPHLLVIVFDIIIIVATLSVWNKIEGPLPKADVRIGIQGQMWYWSFRYPGPDNVLNTADDVWVKQGNNSILHLPINKNVVFDLTSADVLHSFFIKEFRLKQDAVPGRTIQRWFNATKEGRYELACAEICGYNHGKMRNFVIVESNEAYNQYLQKLYAENKVAQLEQEQSK